VRYKAAIFDLDGTLLNTLDDLADAMNEALRQAGFPTHSADSYKLMIGKGVNNLVRRALPRDKQGLVEKTLRAMRDNYAKNSTHKTKIYPGMRETLLKLHQSGIKLAVLTNKDQTFSVRIVEHYFGKNMFRLIWGAEPGRPIKPDPHALIQLLEHFKAGPAEAVFVGDSGVDMDVARAAGVDSVGVTWGFRDRNELVEHGARTIIDKPQELLKLIAGA
jgi:phosphoglycolate phosphatase